MLDAFGRDINYLRLSVTDLCNLRCRYCMPETGVCKKQHTEMLTEEETVAAVKAAASLGITKLRITGGEPLVKKNILSICSRCAEAEGISELCLTTNGILLPEMAKDIKAAGVSRLNISLDTLKEEKYAFITRTGTLRQALTGIEHALDAGFARVKINTVLIGGFNEDEIPELAGLTRKYPVDVRFIELMPMTRSEELGQNAYVSGDAVLSALPELIQAEPESGAAELYSLPGAYGKIGLIRAVSRCFCASCNRIRLTADGKIKPCLHSAQEFSVKGLAPDEMREIIKQAILAKPNCHPPLSAAERSNAGRDMNQIGG